MLYSLRNCRIVCFPACDFKKVWCDVSKEAKKKTRDDAKAAKDADKKKVDDAKVAAKEAAK